MLLLEHTHSSLDKRMTLLTQKYYHFTLENLSNNLCRSIFFLNLVLIKSEL